jgi:hypothetical protein
MKGFLPLYLAISLISLAQTVCAQEYGAGSRHSYLSGERYYPYAYQRHVERRSRDYGYQHPANGYAYPYNNGEHYSPYTYGYSRGYQDR